MSRSPGQQRHVTAEPIQRGGVDSNVAIVGSRGAAKALGQPRTLGTHVTYAGSAVHATLSTYINIGAWQQFSTACSEEGRGMADDPHCNCMSLDSCTLTSRDSTCSLEIS